MSVLVRTAAVSFVILFAAAGTAAADGNTYLSGAVTLSGFEASSVDYLDIGGLAVVGRQLGGSPVWVRAGVGIGALQASGGFDGPSFINTASGVYLQERVGLELRKCGLSGWGYDFCGIAGIDLDDRLSYLTPDEMPTQTVNHVLAAPRAGLAVCAKDNWCSQVAVEPLYNRDGAAGLAVDFTVVHR